jgi:ABC-type transporter Mla MlaB component
MALLAVADAVDGRALPVLCTQLRSILRTKPAEVVTCDVRDLSNPDLATIDGLARLQLTARRLGGSIRLCNARRELVELLELAGLQEAVPLIAESAFVRGVRDWCRPPDQSPDQERPR